MSFWNPDNTNETGPTRPTINQLLAEAKTATEASNKANSFWGKTKEFYRSLPSSYAKVAKDIAQGTARSVATVGVTSANLFTKANNLFWGRNDAPVFSNEISTAGTKIPKAVFGDKPIRDLATASAVTKKDIQPYIGNTASSITAPILAIGSIGLDLSGFGGSKGVKTLAGEVPEAFLKYVAKEKDASIIEQTLKNIGLDNVNSKALSGKLAETKTVDEVKAVLTDASTPVTKTADVQKQGLLGDLVNKKMTVEPGAFDGVPRGIGIVNSVSENLDALAKANPMLFRKAQVATTVEDFIKKVFQNETQQPSTGGIANLTDFYNKVKNVIPDPLTEKVMSKVSPVDKLIAEGKIRVVSRDGRDVYQVQKAGQWVSTRDEDSAIKQVTRTPAKYSAEGIPLAVKKPKELNPADQEKLSMINDQLLMTRQTIEEHPGKVMVKYINRKEGDFTDFRNPDLAKNEADRQRIIKKNKTIMSKSEGAFQNTPQHDQYDSPDVIRQSIEDYRTLRQVEKGLIQQRNDLIKTAKPVEKNVTAPPSEKIRTIDVTRGSGRSLEIQANQALELLNSEPVGIDVSLPKIIENTITPVQNKVHIIDTYLTTPHFVMEKIGFGKEAKMLRDAVDEYWKELPKNIDKITEWAKSVPKESNIRIFKWLDGEAIDLTPAEKKVGTEIKQWLAEWAKKLGLEKDNTITHYITHIFDKELIKKEFDEDLAKIIADKIPGQVYDPFLLKRLGKKGYIQDTWKALDAYVKRATRKQFMDPVLEKIQARTGSSLEVSNIEKSQFNYIKKYIDNINMRPSETEESIDNFLKNVVGYRFGQRPIASVLRFLRQATFRGMLGLNPASALRNLSQGVNTYATLGEKHTIIGYAKLFSKGAGEELAREGVLNAGFVQDRTLSATKKMIEKADKVLFAFFDTAEKINRGSAYFGAKSKYWALNKNNPNASEQGAIDYAKSIVRKTQFVFDTIDTPVGISGDLAKTLLQFQTFTTKQIEFLVQMAKNKNFAGLMRYALAGLAFVYTIGKAFNMKPKELLPWYRFQTPPSLKLPVALVKAVPGVAPTDKYGAKRDLKTKLKDIGNAGLGVIPAGSQIKKTVEGLKSVKEGGVFSPSGTLKYQQGQSTAQKAQSILFGKYASKNANDFYNKDKVTQKTQEPIKKIYDQVQALKASGNEQQAQDIVNNLSDADYEIYKAIRTKEKTANTKKAEQEMLPTVLKINKLVANGKIEEAQAIIDDMTDEEYRIYGLVKKKVK